MKTKIILCFFIFLQIKATAQSPDLLAKSYFLEAQSAYGNGDNNKALTSLKSCIEYLGGESNAKIEALYVDISLAQNDYIKAKEHMALYFEKASEDHSDYMKMVSLLAETTVKAEEMQQRETVKMFNANINMTLAGKEKNKKWGFVDRSGVFIIQPKYDWASNMEYERAIVKKNGKYGVVNNQDVVVIPIVQDTIIRNSNHFIYLKANKYYFIHKSGASLLPEGCFAYTHLEINLYLCHTDEKDIKRKQGVLLNIGNKLLLENIKFYSNYTSYDQKNYFQIRFKDETNCLVDGNGNIEIQPTNKTLDGLSNYRNHRTNIHRVYEGEFLEPTQYYNTITKQTVSYNYHPKYGLSNMKRDDDLEYNKILKNGKVGFVSFKAVITPQFDKITMAYGGFLFVQNNGYHGIVDDTGEIIVPLKYSNVKYNLSPEKEVLKWYGVKSGKNIDVYAPNGKFMYESTFK